MINPLIIQVDDADAQRWFGELIRRGQDLSGLMADISQVLLASTQDRFVSGVGPDGVAWVPLADGSGRTPLSRSGRMAQDITESAGAYYVEISAHARQARWHQFGTDPFEIRPKDKKALNWPGGPGPRGKVNHPGLPARPFIGISAEDGEAIAALAGAWLETGDSDAGP